MDATIHKKIQIMLGVKGLIVFYCLYMIVEEMRDYFQSKRTVLNKFGRD